MQHEYIFKLQTLCSVKDHQIHLHSCLKTAHLFPPQHQQHQIIFEKGLLHIGRYFEMAQQSIRDWKEKEIAVRKYFRYLDD